MVGWISITLFVGFLILLVKVLLDSVTDISAALNPVGLLVIIFAGLGIYYMGSDFMLALSIILLLGVYIKQRTQ